MTEEIETPPPIQITEGTFAAQAATAGRYVLASVGSYAMGKGWIDGELLTLVTGLATVLAPLVYSVWKTHHNKQLLITVGNAAPARVAQVIQK